MYFMPSPQWNLLPHDISTGKRFHSTLTLHLLSHLDLTSAIQFAISIFGIFEIFLSATLNKSFPNSSIISRQKTNHKSSESWIENCFLHGILLGFEYWIALRSKQRFLDMAYCNLEVSKAYFVQYRPSFASFLSSHFLSLHLTSLTEPLKKNLNVLKLSLNEDYVSVMTLSQFGKHTSLVWSNCEFLDIWVVTDYSFADYSTIKTAYMPPRKISLCQRKKGCYVVCREFLFDKKLDPVGYGYDKDFFQVKANHSLSSAISVLFHSSWLTVIACVFLWADKGNVQII